MQQTKKVILLAGPTASGKSELAIKIANNLNCEIINADSMQIYKEISILTSKPNLENMSSIKHHLYGFNSVRKKFSTGHWLQMALEKIDEVWNYNKIPIIVGGTGLYFKALTDGLVKIPEIPNQIRHEIREKQKKMGQKNFFNLLVELDPLAEKFVLPSDTQRSMRVYEVIKFTNKSLFDFKNETKPNFDTDIFKKIFINTPKELLNKKIEKRVEKMLADGAIEETDKFLKMKVYRELSANKIIGIREIKDFLMQKTTLEVTKELIIQKTRRYAKRQYTWARGHMKSWNMVYSANINDLYKKTINIIS